MSTFEENIKIIAMQAGITPEEVLDEMQKAIDHAYDNHDKEAQRLWDRMSFKGERPTPEEFVTQVAMIVKAETVLDLDQ